MGLSSNEALVAAASKGLREEVRRLCQAGADANTVDHQGTPALVKAAYHGYCEIVKELLEARADVNLPTKSGNTALHILAASCDDYRRQELLDTLFDAHAPLNVVNKDGATPLHMAAWTSGNSDVVARLIAKGADLDIQDAAGWTPLMNAVLCGHERIIEQLLQQNAQVNLRSKSGKSALYLASNRHYDAIAQLLVDSGAVESLVNQCGSDELVTAGDDVQTQFLLAVAEMNLRDVMPILEKYPSVISAADKMGNTALHIAAAYQSCDLHKTGAYKDDDIATRFVEKLLQANAPLNVVNHDNSTPLHSASWTGNVGVVNVLVAVGAELDKQDTAGWTPLMNAAHCGHEDIVKLLIDHNAQVNLTSKSGQSALYLAAKHGNDAIVQLLVDSGADVSLVNQCGRDVTYAAGDDVQAQFLQAVNYNETQAVVHLLEKFPSVIHATDESGNTALHVAADRYKQPNEELFDALIQANPPLNAVNHDNSTSLHVATWAGYMGAVETLVAMGADLDIQDAAGYTPLMNAVNGYHDCIAKYLLRHNAKVNVTDKKGNTALHMAVDADCNEIAKLLVNSGADVYIRNQNGQTAEARLCRGVTMAQFLQNSTSST